MLLAYSHLQIQFKIYSWLGQKLKHVEKILINQFVQNKRSKTKRTSKIGLIYLYLDEEYCNFLKTNFPDYNERMVTVPVSFHILLFQFDNRHCCQVETEE